MTNPDREVLQSGSLKEIPPSWEITCDSREDVKDKVFVCIHGRHHDGHIDAAAALERGAALVITERELHLPRELIVPDTREAYAELISRHFGSPAAGLTLVGITGTNGKTTTAHVLAHILQSVCIPTGLIGTDGIRYGDVVLPNPYTTPEPTLLHRTLAQMQAAGIKAVVMEVSSQALEQRRTAGLFFAVAVFTNLTQDHLDYHRDMEDYFHAKERLFTQCGIAVVNGDDPYGRRLAAQLTIPVRPFSMPEEKLCRIGHSQTTWRGRAFSVPLTGEFALSDALAAAEAAAALGIPPEDICRSLSDCPPIAGRAEILFQGRERMILRDYAHTPDAMEKMLSALRKMHFGRIIILFGCGGDRDVKKRPLMGKTAARYADRIILTNDNPRSEEPLSILTAIAAGIKPGFPYVIIPERRAAIEKAIRRMRAGDLLLLAGKGHETYQILKDRTVPFDEKEIVREILESENIPWNN